MLGIRDERPKTPKRQGVSGFSRPFRTDVPARGVVGRYYEQMQVDTAKGLRNEGRQGSYWRRQVGEGGRGWVYSDRLRNALESGVDGGPVFVRARRRLMRRVASSDSRVVTVLSNICTEEGRGKRRGGGSKCEVHCQC